MQKRIKATTWAKCHEHDTTLSTCRCADRRKRNGSYTCPIHGDSICKHINHMRQFQKQNQSVLYLIAYSLKSQNDYVMKQAFKSLDDLGITRVDLRIMTESHPQRPVRRTRRTNQHLSGVHILPVRGLSHA